MSDTAEKEKTFTQNMTDMKIVEDGNISHLVRLLELSEDKPHMDKNAQTALLAGKFHYSQEFRCIDRDNKLWWLNEDVFIEPLEKNQWRLVGVGTNITERKQTEEALQEAHDELEQRVYQRTVELEKINEQLRESLKEKGVLLKEIHHRVKNNLQVMSSLITLQLRNTTEEKDSQPLREIQNRVQSIAIIHEKLHQSEDMARIDFSKYTQSLTAYLYQTYRVVSTAITLKVNVDDIFLDIGIAVPCGLIINELVSNALKYAFTDRREGEIRIDFHSNTDTDNQVTLAVSDNGVGFPQDLDFQNTKSLGLRLVVMLTEQLNGAMYLDGSDGTKFEITFDA